MFVSPINLLHLGPDRRGNGRNTIRIFMLQIILIRVLKASFSKRKKLSKVLLGVGG